MEWTIFTDRIVFSYVPKIASEISESFESLDEHNCICEFVNGCKLPVLAGSTFKKLKKVPWSYGSVPLSGNERMTIGFGYACGLMRATFQFNQEKLGIEGRLKLFVHLDQLLRWGWLSLLLDGRIRDVEIAIDINGATFADYWFVDTRLTTADNSYEPYGTAYLGSKSSGRFLRIYDKAKQLKEKEGVHLDESRLRIEAQLRPGVALTLAQLPNQKSPFDSLIVIDKKALPVDEPSVAAFIAAIKNHWLSAQSAYMLSANRKALRKILAFCQPAWWQPQKFWASYSDSLQWIVSPNLYEELDAKEQWEKFQATKKVASVAAFSAML